VGVHELALQQRGVEEPFQLLHHLPGEAACLLQRHLLALQPVVDGGGERLRHGDEFAATLAGELVGAHRLRRQAQHAANLAGDGDVVAGDHLHPHAVVGHPADHLG